MRQVHLALIYLFLSLLMDVGSILLLAQNYETISGFDHPLFKTQSPRDFWGKRYKMAVTQPSSPVRDFCYVWCAARAVLRVLRYVCCAALRVLCCTAFSVMYALRCVCCTAPGYAMPLRAAAACADVPFLASPCQD